jgi:hypothetical protein
MDVNRKEIKEEIRSDLEEMKEAIRIDQGKNGRHPKEDHSRNKGLAKEMMACQEASLKSKEPTSVEVESIAVHEEAPAEEAAVKTVGALGKRYGDRYLAIGCRLQLQKHPGQWWVPEEVGHRSQTDDSLCRNGME